jgi:F-type H+-transporting ATPase subunit delta
MSELATIARPYSQALFEVAEKNKAISSWQLQLQNISLIASNADVIKILTNPRASKEEKINCFKIAGDLPDQILSFIKILSDINRLLLLPTIIEKYMQLCDKNQEIIKAELTSAKLVDADFLNRLEENLNKRYDANVKVAVKVDESLLGGGVLRVGDDVIDVSLRSKLEKLNHAILEER